jgi:hypothetical protein
MLTCLLENTTDTLVLLDTPKKNIIGGRHGTQNVIGERIVAEMIGEMTGQGTDESGAVGVMRGTKIGTGNVLGKGKDLSREIGKGRMEMIVPEAVVVDLAEVCMIRDGIPEMYGRPIPVGRKENGKRGDPHLLPDA